MSRVVVAFVVLFGVLITAPPARGAAQSDIQKATAGGQAVFLVVTQGNVRGTDRAIQIANQAQKLTPKSTVIVVDRGARENEALVKRLRVLGAPVPLILVMARNGIVAGGALLKDATPQRLVALVPSQKKGDWLLQLSQKKAVFVVVSDGKTMVESRGKVFEACTKAMESLKKKAATIAVDVSEKAEQAWLKELNIKAKEAGPVTIVFNAKGQKTEVFRRVMTAAELVKAVQKKAECCPGGSC